MSLYKRSARSLGSFGPQALRLDGDKACKLNKAIALISDSMVCCGIWD